MARRTGWINDGYKKEAKPLRALMAFAVFWLGEQVIQMGSALWGLARHPEIGDLADQTMYLNTYPLYYLLPYILWVIISLWGISLLGLKLFSRRRWDGRFVVGILGGAVLLMIVQVGTSSLSQWLYPAEAEPVNQTVVMEAMRAMSPWKMLLVIVILPAVTEETFTRGLVMRYLFPNHPVIGILVSSFIFASLHATDLWIHFLTYFLLGCCLGYTYYKTGRIEGSVLVHAFNNLLSIFPYLVG